ncbi:MAG: L,D-transpeptidase [Clostridia bacterium]|nr:L,D-transpeptidase [Clostridia bacterium]MBR5976225.1 L,D-transpeptidase [Clostridia bacterium]MBR5991861.1 L,D-transpeptidase [Clostridia bacterium]MBR6513188.1 L,D-transpeptidase [Clostridia bacterium]
MAKYTRNTNRNRYRTRRQEMMRRRRITTVVAIIFILFVFVLILSSCISHSNKKKAAAEASSKAAAKTTTEGTTEPVTYERDIAFETDEAYAKNHKYCVGVNRKMNVVTVYEKDANNEYTVAVKAFPCSCGIGGDKGETPLGTFVTSDKYEWLKMVDGSYAQYTLRIDGQIWFHSVPYTDKDKGSLESEEYNKLGTAASLGCVRLRAADAKWIYDNIDWRCIVFIYESDTPSPLGTPAFEKIDLNSPNKGWDPTDPDPANPWNKK